MSASTDVPIRQGAIERKPNVIVPEGPKPQFLSRVVREVCAEFQVRPQEIFGPRKTANVALARQVAMVLVRDALRFSLTETAEAFNRRDHGTVLWAERAVESRCLTNKGLRAKVQRLRERVTA